jgi:hypothetical protein
MCVPDTITGDCRSLSWYIVPLFPATDSHGQGGHQTARRAVCVEDMVTGALLLLFDYVGGWPYASKVFIELHRDGLTGCPQANLSRGGLRTLPHPLEKSQQR